MKVNLTDPINYGEKVKVTGIDGDYIKFDGGLTKMAVPVPITEQILDNNFKDITEPHQRIYGGRWVQYEEFLEVEITEYTDGIFQIVVGKVEMGGLPTWRMRMYAGNVHELQHALRLCDIEKEIVL